MKQQKRRAVQTSQPHYPRLEESSLDRRGFLALLGGGTALALVSSACGPGPIAGAMMDPNYHAIDIPTTGHRSLTLFDNTYLSYVLHSHHENRFFNDYVKKNSKRLLKAIDQKLQTSCSYSSLSSKKGIEQVAWKLRVLLEDLFMKDEQQDVAFISLRLEVVRLKEGQRLAGAAPNPNPVP